jgi:hypothetical protein
MIRYSRLVLAICCCFGAACTQGRGASPAVGDKVETRLVRSPRSGALLPRLVRFHDPAIQDKVNRQLDSLADSLSCEDQGAAASSPTDFESTAKVTYAANDILSVSVHASFFCGGPYPTNDANLSVTYDLRTGSLVPFKGLFADYQRDAAEIVRVLFPEKVARAESWAAAGREESGESCDDTPSLFSIDSLLETGFSYVLSPDGLVVQPNFPHVVEACAEMATVSYDKLRRFAAADGILARVAGAP